MLAKNYLVIDNEKMRSDARMHYAKMGAELSFSKFLESNGLCESTFNNATNNYARRERKDCKTYNKAEIDAIYETDNPLIVGVGYMRRDTYFFLLRIFNLEDIYKIPKRTEVQNEEEITKDTVKTDELAEVKNQLIELNQTVAQLNLAIRQIGNITIQMLEKMDKSKPVAVIRKETNGI